MATPPSPGRKLIGRMERLPRGGVMLAVLCLAFARPADGRASARAEGAAPPHAPERAQGAEPDSLRAEADRTAARNAARNLVVGEGGGFASVSAALAAARPGDTVRVRAGVYREHPVVRTPVTLAGDPGAVIEGEGRGTVLTLEAAAEVRGLTIRGSGSDLSREDAGIRVLGADHVKIEDNRLEDVLFGIYLKQSARSEIRGNEIRGKPLPIPQRGDGIRLWYCAGGSIEDNRVSATRDVVIWFSSGVTVRRNRITDGRYGLHYMYSDHNEFLDNVFRRNHVGAFIMYSTDIEFRRNRFADSHGASGMGLGLKDSDDIRAEENVFVGDATGVYLDNSPRSIDARNVFSRNLFLLNDVGILLLPSVQNNRFEGNAIEWNLIPVSVSGGGDALRNTWRGNHWSEYAGFDDDRDGTGDSPFRHERLADDLYARHPGLRIFALSPAMFTLDLLARVFPLLQPKPVVVDSTPLMRPALPSAAIAPQSAGAGPGARAATAAGLMLAAVSAALAMVRLARRREALA